MKNWIALALLFIPLAATGQIAITANAPAYPFLVLEGSTRQINVLIANTGVATATPCGPATSPSCVGTVNWTVIATKGGASATFTDPTHTAVSSISGALPTITVNIGSTAGSCSISPASGNAGPYTVLSTASVTVRAQSTDDTSKTASFVFDVCSNAPAMLANGTSSVVVAPAYQQAYQTQPMTLQSWVTGCVDETGTWSITNQPSGGNGVLADTTNRDTVFTASVTGRYTLKYTANCNSGSNTAIVYVSPNPLPSYAATPNETRPHECYVDPAFTGHDYEVGAGKAYTTIKSTPSLRSATLWAPGTIMRIWNTDTTGSNPSVFYEYHNIATSGTATQPIIVCGVPDSLGNLPIMDGTNATAQSDDDSVNAGGGIISLWPTAGHYNYWQSGAAGPNYVIVTGLELRNANSTLSYFKPGSTKLSAWGDFTPCLNFRSGSYVDISGNELDNCSLGMFSDDNDNNAWATITQNLTFMGNHVQQAGDPKDVGGTHEEYVQTFYALLEGNKIDNPTASVGSMWKWRGVEGIFRYNYVGNGGQRLLDLDDNSDGLAYVTIENYLASGGMWYYGDRAGANMIAAYQESQQKDFIYGNEMIGTSAGNQIHYSGDQDVNGLQNRNGILYFYNNTLDNARDVFDLGQGGSGTDTYFQQRVDARNNILWGRTTAYTGLVEMAFARQATVIMSATTNLMQTGTFTIATPIEGAAWNKGSQEGWPNSCDSSTCPWPLTVPLNAHLFNLSAANYLTTSTIPYSETTFLPVTSAPVRAGTVLTGNPVGYMPVRSEYNTTTHALATRRDAAAPTIGAVQAQTGIISSRPAL